MLSRFEVIVGHIGVVYRGDDAGAALAVFAEYVAESKTGTGRAGDEPVTLMDDGQIQFEYAGSRQEEV